MEVESNLELDYLQKISSNFWLGARRSMKTGLWHWQESGMTINFGLWNISTKSPGEGLGKNHKRDYNSHGGLDEYIAVSEKKTFRASKDTSHSGVDVICEVPSRFAENNPAPRQDSFPAQEWDIYNGSSVTNSTYLFSKFMLPWASAQELCTEREGSLAEVESPQENEDLIARVKKSFRRDAPSLSRWLGAKSQRDSNWIWRGKNRSFELAFTDWKPDQRSGDNNSSCLFVSEVDNQGFYWESDSCINWKHFICEIASSDSSTAVAEPKEYLGDEVCQQNTYQFDGFATTVKNCFHLVRLQYSFEKAEAFCQEKLNESVADVDEKERQKFEPLLRNNLGNREKVRSRF